MPLSIMGGRGLGVPEEAFIFDNKADKSAVKPYERSKLEFTGLQRIKPKSLKAIKYL